MCFLVYCDLQYNATHAHIQLSHDAEERTHVSGYEDPGSYQKMVTYDRITYPQLESLFEFESRDYHIVCNQDIKYECKGKSFGNWFLPVLSLFFIIHFSV